MSYLQHPFVFPAISDEAGQDIGTQIRAHHNLDWRYIEARLANGTQFTNLPQAQFDEVCAELAAAGMQVSGFAQFTHTREWYDSSKPYIAYIHIKAHIRPGEHTPGSIAARTKS